MVQYFKTSILNSLSGKLHISISWVSYWKMCSFGSIMLSQFFSCSLKSYITDFAFEEAVTSCSLY